MSRYPPSPAPARHHEGTCSITIACGTRVALGAALPLAGFAPSTTGRFSGVHRGDPAATLDLSERRTRVTLLLNLLRTEIDTSVGSQEDRDDMEYILMALVEENETPADIERASPRLRRRQRRLPRS